MNNEQIFYGINVVLELLNSDNEIECVYIDKNTKNQNIKKIIFLCKEKKIIVKYVDSKKLDMISQNQRHQGVAILISMIKYYSIDDIFEYDKKNNKSPFLIICDGIEDPHNLGAILRTADAVDASGVIIPNRNSVSVNSTVYKTSAGACAHIKICKVSNINTTISLLKKKYGLFIYGADMDGQTYNSVDYSGPVGLVLGREGKGISRIVRENCDFLISLPMNGKVDSLNVSVSAGILMYKILESR